MVATPLNPISFFKIEVNFNQNISKKAPTQLIENSVWKTKF
jgi:hypothetical protein